MATYLYIIIRLASAIYILYQCWFYLFKSDKVRFWKLFIPKQKQEKQVGANPLPVPEDKRQEVSIVGKSHTVYLPEYQKKEIEPFLSEELEPSGYFEEEDIPADGIKMHTYQESIDDILGEDERFLPFEESDYPDDDFSTGMTYEALSNAVDVVMGQKDGEADRLQAARTLFEVRQTDMMDFFSSQIGNMEVIEQLFRENLDENGLPLPQRQGYKRTEQADEFDMDKFV